MFQTLSCGDPDVVTTRVAPESAPEWEDHATTPPSVRLCHDRNDRHDHHCPLHLNLSTKHWSGGEEWGTANEVVDAPISHEIEDHPDHALLTDITNWEAHLADILDAQEPGEAAI